MKLKIAINGFGRIGRLTLRAIIERNIKNLEVVAINDLGNLESNIHLLKYDSIHGILNEQFKLKNESLLLQHHKIRFLKEPDPENLPWNKLDVDLVIECTGRFTSRSDSEKHLKTGAKKVLISAPAKDPDMTVVYGINHMDIKKTDKIISNGSCTTNCLAPFSFFN